MHAISNFAPTNIAALDEKDLNAGGANHLYGIQFGGPQDLCRIQFQHGARAQEGSTAGVFDDDLLAIIEDRLVAFQAGPYSCSENQDALDFVRAARASLGRRVAARISRGVLGVNAKH